MQNAELKERTKRFAIDIIRLVEGLPTSRVAGVLGSQLLRSGTSVGANYRSACRAKSRADFIAKMGVVEEEADETGYWMELLLETKVVSAERVKSLRDESSALTAIAVSSIKTARDNR